MKLGIDIMDVSVTIRRQGTGYALRLDSKIHVSTIVCKSVPRCGKDLSSTWGARKTAKSLDAHGE